MKAPYRAHPGKDGTILFSPYLRVSVGKKHTQKSRPFEALVDSGASDCIFHESIAKSIGIKIETGKKEQRTGISGAQDVWVHPILLYVGASDVLSIDAAFAKSLPVAGLLGRVGFFDHYKITFDPTNEPPGLELERVHKA